MLVRRHRQDGLTLVELLVGLAILGALLTQALPAFSAWLQNQRIRNSAESILNGLQVAKAQAVRSNLSTELALLPSTMDPVPANVGAAASATGTNWIVRTFQSTGAYTAADFVQGRSGKEGSAKATVAASQGSFVFTPLGRLLNPPPADVVIAIDHSDSYSGKRPMRVVVTIGGAIRMCDPNGPAGNPQTC